MTSPAAKSSRSLLKPEKPDRAKDTRKTLTAVCNLAVCCTTGKVEKLMQKHEAENCER